MVGNAASALRFPILPSCWIAELNHSGLVERGHEMERHPSRVKSTAPPTHEQARFGSIVPPDDRLLPRYVAAVLKHLPLSPKQAEVAIGIWAGLSEKQVAAWLGRAEGTVHAHLRKIHLRLRQRGFVGQVGIAIAAERALTESGFHFTLDPGDE